MQQLSNATKTILRKTFKIQANCKFVSNSQQQKMSISHAVLTNFKRAEAEVFAYREEGPISTADSLLVWWKTNGHKYPLLSAVGKKYLCVPATSVPSERVFSTAGDIVTAQRSALKFKDVDKVMF